MLLNGSLQAMGKVGLKMNVSRENLGRLVLLLPSLKAPTISNLHSEDWLAVETIVSANIIRELIPSSGSRGRGDHRVSIEQSHLKEVRAMRKATIQRKTTETDVSVEINLGGREPDQSTPRFPSSITC